LPKPEAWGASVSLSVGGSGSWFQVERCTLNVECSCSLPPPSFLPSPFTLPPLAAIVVQPVGRSRRDRRREAGRYRAFLAKKIRKTGGADGPVRGKGWKRDQPSELRVGEKQAFVRPGGGLCEPAGFSSRRSRPIRLRRFLITTMPAFVPYAEPARAQGSSGIRCATGLRACSRSARRACRRGSAAKAAGSSGCASFHAL